MNQSTHTNTFRADDSFSLEDMKNLGELLSALAARNAQRAAIAFEEESISYESLEHTQAAADALHMYVSRRRRLRASEHTRTFSRTVRNRFARMLRHDGNECGDLQSRGSDSAGLTRETS